MTSCQSHTSSASYIMFVGIFTTTYVICFMN